MPGAGVRATFSTFHPTVVEVTVLREPGSKFHSSGLVGILQLHQSLQAIVNDTQEPSRPGTIGFNPPL